MDRLLEQKQKSDANFRLKINDFVSKSQYARKSNQFTNNVLQQLLNTPLFDGVCNNGKVNIQKLCEKVTAHEPHVNPKELLKILGNKKQMKIAELQQLLKNYQLHQFDLEEQMVHLLYDGNNLSLKKLDTVMNSLGMPLLTPKDRELLVQCFDFDKDGSISREDLAQLMQLCKGGMDQLRMTQFRQ